MHHPHTEKRGTYSMNESCNPPPHTQTGAQEAHMAV